MCRRGSPFALLAREFAVTGLRAIAASEGLIISAKEGGKQKTALQMIGTMFLLIHFRYPVWLLEHVTIADEPLLIDFHAGRHHHAGAVAGDVDRVGGRLFSRLRARGAGALPGETCRRTPPTPPAQAPPPGEPPKP